MEPLNLIGHLVLKLLLDIVVIRFGVLIGKSRGNQLVEPMDELFPKRLILQ